MAIVTLTSRTATISTTAYSLVNGNTSGVASSTSPGRLFLYVDGTNITASDRFEIRLYEKAVSGGTQRLVRTWTIAQKGGSKPYDLGHVAYGWDVTLIKISGTDRSISASLRLIDDDQAATATAISALPAAVIAATALRAGTATAGDLVSITLDASAPTTVDLFKGAIVEIVGGTGAGQCETITSYTSGRRAFVNAFVTAPDATSVFIIRGAVGRLAMRVMDDVARILGISKDNAMLDRTVYSGGKMTGARLRVFGDASELAAATADTPNDNDDGEIQRYTVAATYSGDEIASYSMARVL